MTWTRKDYFECDQCRYEFDTMEEADECCPSGADEKTEWTCDECGKLEFEDDEPSECERCEEGKKS